MFFSFYSLRILDFSHAFAGTISLTVKVKRTRKKKNDDSSSRSFQPCNKPIWSTYCLNFEVWLNAYRASITVQCGLDWINWYPPPSTVLGKLKMTPENILSPCVIQVWVLKKHICVLRKKFRKLKDRKRKTVFQFMVLAQYFTDFCWAVFCTSFISKDQRKYVKRHDWVTFFFLPFFFSWKKNGWKV